MVLINISGNANHHISDNDLNPDLATQIYAFAIDASLLNVEQQLLPGPLYPPGQIKKALE